MISTSGQKARGSPVRSRAIGLLTLAGLIIGLVASISHVGWAQLPEDLFMDSPEPGPLARKDPSVLRTRFVNINTPFLTETGLDKPRDVMSLNLFSDLVFTARLERSGPTLHGSSWAGHIDGVEFSDVIFVVVEGIVAGNITLPGGKSYAVEYAGNGVHAIYEINEMVLPPNMMVLPPNMMALHSDGAAHIPPEKAPAQSTTQITQPHAGDKIQMPIANPTTDDGSVIDVMVVYTPQARTNAGGTSAIQATINLMVATTNTAYINSNISTSLNLVHTEEVSYTEDGSSNDLYNLTYTGGIYSAMDNVQTLRDTYGADLVALITDPTSVQYCGIAWIMTSVSTAFAPWGFSVTLRWCGGLTFAHELGHNQGMHHDWYVNPETGAYTYSHGHVKTSANWLTIMSYYDKCADSGVSCSRITYFSNPSVLYNGNATGVPIGTNITCTAGNLSNPDCDAHNAQTLTNTKFTVANFRVSGVSPPAAPSSLTTAAISSSQINLGWQDNSNNESLFKIERKTGTGGTFSQIATVGADVTSYPNTGLAQNTQYCYRVKASNGGGDSAYSNESCATTPGLANDNFANAQAISGSTGTTTGSNVGATKESGEPNHAGNAGGASIWYNWTAPLNGNATINTTGSNFDTLLGVYTGSSVSSLTLIASNDDSGGTLQSSVTFAATGGTTYRIAVDGYNGATGSVVLNWVVNTPALFRVERSTGNVYTDGSFIGGGADVAEHINVSESVEPGDLIEIDPQKLSSYRKTRGPHSSLVAGVISTKPGLTLGNRLKEAAESTNNNHDLRWSGEARLSRWIGHPGRPFLSLSITLASVLGAESAEQLSIAMLAEEIPRSNPPLLALAGRVYVKATTENGRIRVGDLLVSATKPGYAMRCVDANACEGSFIGKALQSLESGEGLILILVTQR
jgi:hypothetical protein